MEDLSPRERRSKAMFGTKDVIDVFGVILRYTIEPPETFTVQDVRQEFFDLSAINDATIRRNLTKLEGLGAIQRVPSEQPGFCYQRASSSFWELLVEPMVAEEIDKSLKE